MKISKKKQLIAISIIMLFVLIASISIHIFNLACLFSTPKMQASHLDPIVRLSDSDPSYLLLTPIVPNRPNSMQVGGKVYLTDLYGNPLHTWSVKYSPFYSVLKPDGKLLVLAYRKNSSQGPFGIDPVIQELDWNSTVLSEYANSTLHHDFTYLPNGNLAVLITENLTSEQKNKIAGGLQENSEEFKRILANKIAAGIPQNQLGNNELQMTEDVILEVDKNGKTVWEWRVWGHLNPTEYALEPYERRTEWTHANSIQYLANNPIDGEEGYIISFRQISTIIIVRKHDGTVVWRSPKGIFDHQHDATILQNGNILVFNNGGYNRETDIGYLGSQAVEINPKTNEIEWMWQNGTSPYETGLFEASIVGGAQRLKNGNTLITDGLHGHLFEVTNDKKLVWDFHNPFPGDTPTGLWQENSIFKARRYRLTDVNFPQSLPPPLPFFPTQCHILTNKIQALFFK